MKFLMSLVWTKDLISAQLKTVSAYYDLGAIKTNAMDGEYHSGSGSICRTNPDIPVIVDPVMIATSGAKLVTDEAIESFKSELFQEATITPNLDEAEVLLGHSIGVDNLEACPKSSAIDTIAMCCKGRAPKGDPSMCSCRQRAPNIST